VPWHEAALDCLKRVARNFDNDEKRLQQVDLSFYPAQRRRILRRIVVEGQRVRHLYRRKWPHGVGCLPPGSKGLATFLADGDKNLTKKMSFPADSFTMILHQKKQVVCGLLSS
jgi:hypothetical protein